MKEAQNGGQINDRASCIFTVRFIEKSHGIFVLVNIYGLRNVEYTLIKFHIYKVNVQSNI